MKTHAKPQHGSTEWLMKRWRDETGKVLFGASDAPILMGASPFKTRTDLFLDKTNPPTLQPETAAFRRGNLLEAPLIQVVAKEFGIPLYTPDVMYQRDRFMVSLDGVDNEENPTVVIEAKTTSAHTVKIASDLPTYWLWQGWAQTFVTGAPVIFVVLDRNMDIAVIQCPHNDAAMEQLQQEAERFGNAVESKMYGQVIEFDSLKAAEVAALYPATDTTIEIGEEGANLVLDLETARQRVKQAQEYEDSIKDEIAKLLLNNEVGTFNGEKVVSWKQQQGKRMLDTTRFKAEQPEMYAMYEKQGQPFRVLRTHKTKEK